jgi:hypothetical protein
MWIPEVLAILVGGAFLAWSVRGLTFFQDEWDFIALRLTTSNVKDAYLLPHVQHFLGFDVALYKAVFAVAGLRHYWPYQLVALLGHLMVVILLFELARRRIGARLGFFVVLPVIVLGTAWETLLFPFNEQWIYSVAAMLGVILLLDRKDRRGDVVIFAVLLVAIATSSFGPVVAAGVLVRLLWEPDRCKRAWVALIPLALYGLWYVNYGANAPGPPGYRLTASPTYLLQTAAASVAGVLGVPLGGNTVAGHRHILVLAFHALTLGFQVLTLGLVLVLAARRPRLTPNLAMLLTMLGLYWLSLTLQRGFLHAPYTSRYIYVSAVLVIVIGLELYRGRQISSTARHAVMVVASVATVLNAAVMLHYSSQRRHDAAITAAEIGALNVARSRSLPASFQIDTQDIRIDLQAGPYLAAIDRLHSSPAPGPAGILAAPEFARAAADRELIRADNINPVPLTPVVQRLIDAAYPELPPVRVEGFSEGTVVRVGRCVLLRPSRGRQGMLRLAVTGAGTRIDVRANSQVTVRLRRFTRTFRAAPPATINQPVWMPLPRGNASLPWHLQLTASVPVQAC